MYLSGKFKTVNYLSLQIARRKMKKSRTWDQLQKMRTSMTLLARE